MQPVTLKFPDVDNIVNFVVRQRLTHVETNSGELTLTGELSEKQITIACEHYGATLLQGSLQQGNHK